MKFDRWFYSVWFRDVTLDADEQDHEWVAVLEIHAETAALAKEWGDHLAHRRVTRDPSSQYIRSEVLSANDPLYSNTKTHSAPSVLFGFEATDAQLGW